MELIAIQVLPWETISNEFQIAKKCQIKATEVVNKDVLAS